MSKLTTIIRAKVVEVQPSKNEKDLAKGIKFEVILESEKKLTENLTVPDFIKVKSFIEVKANSTQEQLFEVEAINIADGRMVKTYYRILKKFELKQ